MTWLAGWTRRRTKAVDGLTISDYQMKLLVHKSGSTPDTSTDIYLQGNVKDDFSDIRFTAPDQTTVLSYWIESITGTTPNMVATIWVKIPTLTPTNNIYIYYDNPTAPNLSSPTSTMLKYIDNGNIVNWIIDPLSGTQMPSITAGSGTSTIISSMAFSHALAYQPVSLPVTDFIFETRIISSDTSRTDQCIFTQMNGTYGTYRRFVWTEIPSNTNNAIFSIGGTFSFGTYYRLVQKIKTNNANGRTEIILNDNGTTNVQVVNQPLYEPASQGYPITAVEIGKTGGSGHGTYLMFDWMFYRKYDDPEPTFGLSGSEETNITATSMTITPSETPCRNNICTVTVHVTWTNNGNSNATFVPNITIDTVPISPDPYTPESLAPTASVIKTFVISNLAVGTHNICPYPN